MSIILNDNLDTQFNKPLDTRFGAYIDIPTALTQVPLYRRYIGLTIGIGTNPVVEYWFNDGIQDSDLVLKTPDINYPVTSVNGKTGAVVLDKNDIGLGNVDNTSDANKPISTATQTALNSKQDTLVSGTNIKTVNSNSLVGNGDVVIDKTSVGLGNVTNVDTTNADNITSGTLSDSRLSTNVTTQGNTFNAANKLVQLDATAKLPAVDGSKLTNLPTPSTPTLAQVTTAGNTTTNAITVGLINSTALRAIVTITDTTGGINNPSYFGSYENFLQLAVNRNPSTGLYAQTGKASSQISLEGDVGTSSIRFYTTTTNNSIPSERLRIFGNGNITINTTTDAGYKLDVNGTVRIQGDISLITKDANSNTRLQVSNISTGSQASAEFWLTSNGGTASWSKFSSNRTTYKIQKANDAGLYNGTAGDITFLNDVSTGKILFSAGGSATAQVTLFSNGNVGINTTTDAGYKLDVNGSTRIKGAGNTQATTAFIIQNSDNSQLFKITNDGATTIGAGNQGLSSHNATFSGYLISTGTNGNVFGTYTSFIASAIVQCDSTTRGFLPPRMTTTQKNAISTPAAGLVVYDTTLSKLCVYTSAWETITSI